MTRLLHPELVKIMHEFWYRCRFLFLYIVIGVLSLLLELAIRSQLLFLGIHIYPATAISLMVGILFAFSGNTFLNFRIPPTRRHRALVYFVVISLLSGTLQWSVVQVLDEIALSYDQGRLIISSGLFIVAYLLHRRFTFRDFKRVGVAIYANGVEDIQDIHERIGQFPDFIHVDIVDQSFAPDALKSKAYRMETIRAFWPNREIQTHIMSKSPSDWLPEVLPFSDTVYVHWECDESIEQLLKTIRSADVHPGVALTLDTALDEPDIDLSNADSVLLLTIKEPGKSGQKFDMVGMERIEQLNQMPSRKNFRICIDGGLNEKVIPLLQVEDAVSGSSVLNHVDPKGQILYLQTAGRYGLI